MALRLTLDQGNTAAKAAVWRDGEIVAEASLRHISAADVDLLASQAGGRFDASIYCSVKQPNPEVTQAMRRNSGRFVELSHDTPLPLRISYRTPATLGRDRIAAAVGAYSLTAGHLTLVVDCGTAITYDVVTPDGTFAGGNIAPGIFMRLEALHRFTASLPSVQPDAACPQWGCDTATAMQAGAIDGAAAELLYYRDRLSAGGDVRIVLTGGSAGLLAQRCQADMTVVPNLVQKGLNCILDYNENI